MLRNNREKAMEELSKEEYEAWLENPTTRRFMNYLKLRQENFKEQYFGCTPTIETLSLVNHIRGAIDAFRVLLEPDLYTDINIAEGDHNDEKNVIGD